MQLLYGTYNPAKLAVMRRWLSPAKITLVGLFELDDPPPQAEENGINPLENARIKALGYCQATGMTTLAADTGLYLDGLADDMQPAAHARRTYGKLMDDEEMIAYYAALAASCGGRVKAQYRNAVCVAFPDGRMIERYDESVASRPFYLVDTPHPRRTPGFPLDSLSVDIESGQYYLDMSISRGDTDLAERDGYCAFVLEALEGYI